MLSFLIVCLFPLVNKAQFVERVMPAAVHAESSADTLLNTRQVLLKAGVKEWQVSNSDPGITKTFASKRCKVDSNGRVAKIITCFHKNQSTGFTHCITDTIVYEIGDRIKSMRETDNANNPPMVYEGSAVNENKSQYTRSFDKDTSFSQEIYDRAGRLIHYMGKNGSAIYNTRYYYNADGLLDSMVHAGGETYVFKRSIKRRNKIVEMQTLTGNYFRWDFNVSGQCVGFIANTKYRPGVVFANGYKKDLKLVIRYYYNDDGTLSKVVNKRSDIPTFTLNYSYIK